MKLCKQRSRGRAVCGNGVFLKEYSYRSPWQKFRRSFGAPRPFVALEAAERLAKLGIPTPKVLAAARGVAPDGSVYDLLATEELKNVVFGDAFVATEDFGGSSSLAEELAPMACQMHDGGFCHGDLSLRNWYRDDRGDWGVIDLDGARITKRVSHFRRSLELARLASSCFIVVSGAGGDAAALAHVAESFWNVYDRCGGAAFRGVFERRTRKLVNRFRRKYLNLGKLK